MNLNILLLDDDPVYRNFSHALLKKQYHVYTAEKPSEAFKILQQKSIHILICDFKLPEIDGLQVIDKVKKAYPNINVIIISNYGDTSTVIQAMRKGASDYLKKPFTADELYISLRRVKHHAEINQKRTTKKKKGPVRQKKTSVDQIPDIVGNSEAINGIKQQMQRIAQAPGTSVLIIGESGTGKELVAKGIHRLSHSGNQLFQPVNMSAVPDELFESTFFGHKKGSFTGAVEERNGIFEKVNNGTLFLDEIGEMTKIQQVKLLRVLDEQKFTKIGSKEEQQFDARIIAATNKNLHTLREGKQICDELFYRLSTFVIQIPSLRQRKDDIPELIEYFFNRLSKKLGRQISSIHPKVFKILENYDFPGNIHELKNMIEKAIIVCQGKELLPEHFTNISHIQDSSYEDPGNIQTLNLRAVEKQTIMKALRQADYNKTEAARLLNIDFNTLRKRINRYNIEEKKS